ncbi:UNVERIFIED_CONTAM: hypothetical protein GTU68_022928, partial [Idotea baltica]|nr:hypothetical protein [Idotea baltica]
LTTTVRVIDRVHRNTANGGALALPTGPTSFTEVLVRVIRVRNRAHRRHAFLTNETQLTGTQTDLGVATVTTNKLNIRASRPCDLTTLTGLHLDIVDDRTDWHARERHCVAWTNIDLGTGDDLITHGQALRRKNIVQLTVFVLYQRDKGRAVRVIFDPFDGRGHIPLPSFEIDNPVKLLRAPANPTRRDPARVIPATLFRQTLRQSLLGATFIKISAVDQHQPSLARRRRLILF